MMKVPTAEQRFYERGKAGLFTFIAVKVVDDPVFDRNWNNIEFAFTELISTSKLEKCNTFSKLIFLGCLLTVGTTHITLSMAAYQTRIKIIQQI